MKLSNLTIFVLLTAIVFTTSARAAPILFHEDVSTSVTFNMNTGESRVTLFQAFNDVTLTQLGAHIDPDSSASVFDWRIYAGGTQSPATLELEVTGITFTDIGLGIYDISVDKFLQAGFYTLELMHVSGGNSMLRYDESLQSFPYITTDSNFRIFNGFTRHISDPPNTLRKNAILPAFSVSTTTSSIPEPATFALLSLGLAGLGFARRKRKSA